LRAGLGVLFTTPTTVFLTDPFAYLYRDSDIEAMSTCWDDGSATGYNHVLDDPSMGFTRFCHGSRIVGYEPGLFFAMPTAQAATIATRMGAQLRRQPSLPAEERNTERELWLKELWLPSHHGYAAVGAILRVMNHLCFVNSKVLFRQLRQKTKGHPPVLVQINFHSDAIPRMAAVIARYLDGDPKPLSALPLADSSGKSAAEDTKPLSCDDSSRAGGEQGAAAGDLVAKLQAQSPFAWAGVGDMIFKADGVLSSPWGVGKWGAHPGDSAAIFADFVGTRHNVRIMPSGLGISTRCTDNNVVLLRSIKKAKSLQGS